MAFQHLLFSLPEVWSSKPSVLLLLEGWTVGSSSPGLPDPLTGALPARQESPGIREACASNANMPPLPLKGGKIGAKGET